MTMSSQMIDLLIKGSEGPTQVIHIDKNGYLKDLMRKINEKMGLSIENQRLLYEGKSITSDFGEYKMVIDLGLKDRSMLFLTFRQNVCNCDKSLKGTVLGDNTELPNDRDLKTWDTHDVSAEISKPQTAKNDPKVKIPDDDVELSNDPDMITWDTEGVRVKLPCGHAIGPEMLTEFCREQLSGGKISFLCPYKDGNGPKCNTEWDYSTVKKLAALTDEEKSEFETKLSLNYIQKQTSVQQCPECKSFCSRINTTTKRVKCTECSGKGQVFAFCWDCLHEWKPNNRSECGNVSCSNEDQRLKILKDAPLKNIVGLEGCPSIRSCPHCGCLINHKENCKHMACASCGQKFCFICLKTDKDGKYTCGSYNSHCTIAAVQTNLSKMDKDHVTNGNDKKGAYRCIIM